MTLSVIICVCYLWMVDLDEQNGKIIYVYLETKNMVFEYYNCNLRI